MGYSLHGHVFLMGGGGGGGGGGSSGRVVMVSKVVVVVVVRSEYFMVYVQFVNANEHIYTK